MNNQTVIDTVVKYSKDCITKRFIKEHLKKAWLLARLQNLPSANSMKILIDELDFRLNEKESDIGKLLTPLFEGKEFGHKLINKYSLTINEIREGYILLGGEKYVILLRPFHSISANMEYVPGVLYQFSGSLENDIITIKRSKEEIIPEDLLNLIIKKKIAYEYIEGQ